MDNRINELLDRESEAFATLRKAHADWRHAMTVALRATQHTSSPSASEEMRAFRRRELMEETEAWDRRFDGSEEASSSV